jgi:hypothetical protein
MFKKQITKKQASSLIYMIFFIFAFLAFIAFVVDGTITFANSAKLQSITEATALAAAAEFNYSSSATTAQIQGQVGTIAYQTFKLLKQNRLNVATCNVLVNVSSRTVTISSEYISQPFFLSFLGVSGIKLEANASAISEPLYVTANYEGVNWLTASAAYLSDILSLSEDSNLNDTAILTPVGNFPAASYSNGFPLFNLIDEGDNKSLSLGPGGFITIKLPAPIVDKPGYDLFIEEAGDALEGYMVFAGLDVDSTNPYVNANKTGGGIYWVNISSIGTSAYSALGSSANQTASGTQLSTSTQDKFYGSGYFDIGKISGVSMVKYIRIVDDNQESAFMATDGTYYKTMIRGEASTATAGADIDYVEVMNHVKLVD